jgi:hypothetical protein
MNPLDPSSKVLQTFLQAYQTKLTLILKILKINLCMNHAHHFLFKNYLNPISQGKIFVHFCFPSFVVPYREAIRS